MNNVFDSHAHYDSKSFNKDRKELLKTIHENGVVNIVNIATSMHDLDRTINLVREYDFIYGALGIHPSYAENTPENFIATLEQKVLSEPKIKAIGEIGLDYHYEEFDKERQKKVFIEQLELAEKFDMPVVIHSRDACEDTMNILLEYKPKCVMHCFNYSAEIAQEVVKLDMYVSFTGILTFNSAKKVLRAVETVPMDKIMLETDCPYMAPEPFRGKRCDSSMIEMTAAKMAEIKGVTTQEMLDITCENAKRFFGI